MKLMPSLKPIPSTLGSMEYATSTGFGVSPIAHSRLVFAATPAAVAVLLLLLVLQEVFSDTAQDGTADCP